MGEYTDSFVNSSESLIEPSVPGELGRLDNESVESSGSVEGSRSEAANSASLGERRSPSIEGLRSSLFTLSFRE